MGRPIRLRDAAVARAGRERERIVALAARGSGYAIQPTIQHVVEQYIALGDRAGALAAVRAIAAAHVADDNPGAAAQALYFGWQVTRETDLLHEREVLMCAPDMETDDRTTTRSFIARRDARECAKITRCNLRWRHSDASFVGTLVSTAPVAASWLVSCTFALWIDGTSVSIACSCEVLRSAPHHIMVRCMPNDPTSPPAFLQQCIWANATGTATNLRSLSITPPAAPSHRVENAMYAPQRAATHG